MVYRAWHPRLNAEIAIKRLRLPCHPSDSVLIHEALILSSVRSSAFPRPLDVRRFGEETFLFLELIHGEPLTSCGPCLDQQQIVRLLRDLLIALRELHAAELVHLDLSPTNILVDESGRTRLIDFGLARRAHGPRDPDLPVGGTPGFIAPELLRPDVEIDHRADLYGAGAILYFLLHGEPPSPSGDRPGALRRPPAADFLRSRLDALCERALDSDPNLRWKSADEFLLALEEIDVVPSKPRRWLTAGAMLLAACLGPHERLLDTARAEILVVRPDGEQRLRESPPLHLGDHIAFAFDADGSGAGLIVRAPSGTVVRLRPFHRVPSGAFRFPADGGAVLRQERGTYVVFFSPAKSSELPDGLFPVLADLPSPPALNGGETLVLTRGAAETLSLQPGTSEGIEEWIGAFLRCERRFPGLVAIAFPVE